MGILVGILLEYSRNISSGILLGYYWNIDGILINYHLLIKHVLLEKKTSSMLFPAINLHSVPGCSFAMFEYWMV